MVPSQSNEYFEMSSSGKLILCLAVIFCVVQAIAAKPRYDSNFVENVKYDLLKKCAGLEKDFDKESLKIKHKLMKESSKMLKKAVKAGSPECIESARLQAEEQLEEKVQETQECIQDLKESIDTALSSESTLPEIMSFRTGFKNNLQKCKNSGKTEMKVIQNNFSAAGKSCLV